MDHPAPWELYATLAREADRAREIVYTKLVNVPQEMTEEYRYPATISRCSWPRTTSARHVDWREPVPSLTSVLLLVRNSRFIPKK